MWQMQSADGLSVSDDNSYTLDNGETITTGKRRF